MPDESGWRTIDSAPKDGTRILVIDEQGDYDIASWHRDHTCGLHYGCMNHTHWMPLPPPPKDSHNERSEG